MRKRILSSLGWRIHRGAVRPRLKPSGSTRSGSKPMPRKRCTGLVLPTSPLVPGDVLLFKTVSGTPHSIVFEAEGLSGPAHEALNGAMARRAGDLSSPLLSPDGAEYRITVPALNPGPVSSSSACHTVPMTCAGASR